MSKASYEALERRVATLESVLLAHSVYPVRDASGRPRHQKYPKFWADLPVREAVIALHRQVTIDAAVRNLASRFGADRAPSASALQRCWKQLDLTRGTIASQERI